MIIKWKFTTAFFCIGAVFQAHAAINFFSNESIINQVDGSLGGMVKFAQTHTIDPTNNGPLEMPRLVSNRSALLIFMPTGNALHKSISVTAYGVNGTALGTITLTAPKNQPKLDKFTPVTTEMPDVVYSEKAWTGVLPAKWINPELKLVFSSKYTAKTSTLNAIDIGGSNELVIQNIRIGMLTPPRDDINRLENEPLLASDYFQKIPVSKLIVAHYAPVYFTKIVLPNGTIYEDASTDQGDVYSGDMRSAIAKNLISVGINLANFGISSSNGNKDEQWQPGYFNEIVVHIARGKYANGIVDHGLSGGNGMATLYDTVGNEFSHELGHAYGLGHYPGGGRWSTHNLESGLGWDEYKNRFIANFYWDKTGETISNDGYITPPMRGIYQFNTDAMAGGAASSPLSQYTLHTGYSAKRIQQFFEKMGRTSKNVPSRYIVWDEETKKMVDRNDPSRRKPHQFGIPVTTLVGFYDPENLLPSYIYPPLYGSYGHVFRYENPAPQSCHVDIRFADNSMTKVPVNSTRIDTTGSMNKFHVNVPTNRNATHVDVLCADKTTGKDITLASRDITTPPEIPRPTVIVGEEDGYKSVAKLAPTFEELGVLAPSSYQTISHFESKLTQHYGNISDFSSLDCRSQKSRAGQVYAFENPIYSTRDYYILLSDSIENTPPEDRVLTNNWKYLGSAETFVNFSLNPLLLSRSPLLDSDAKIKKYFDIETLYPEVSIGKTTIDRQIFYKDIPQTNDRFYFIQKQAGQGAALPSDKLSTPDWYFVASTQDILNIQLATADQFDILVKDWYKQNPLGNWGDNQNQGKTGSIFKYDNTYSNTIDYFRLLKERYWYFPIDQTSNADWEYLGSFKKT